MYVREGVKKFEIFMDVIDGSLLTFSSTRASNEVTLDPSRMAMAAVSSPASAALAANVLVEVLSGAATASKSSIEVIPARADLWNYGRQVNLQFRGLMIPDLGGNSIG